MSQSRDFGPLAGQMRSALERYSKEELIDLMTHLVRVYVMEDTAPSTPDVHRPQAPEELTTLSFPQLLLRLQMMLQHEELARFRVSGDDVFVTIGDTELNFHGPAPEGKQPSAAQKAIQSMRGAPDVDEPEEDDEEAAPPSSPVTGEPDFEIDDIRKSDADEDKVAASSGASSASEPESEPSRPAPEPLGPRAGGGRGGGVFGGGSGGGGGRGGGVFGGGGGRRSPAPPPPIAESAPGDPSPDERAAANRQSAEATEENGERRSRAGFEDGPPPLADGDKQINPSNRFADLELD